ncbi:LysR family transcriptional regulator [Massilia sp. CCM 8734]|uniref:LysR family transcriptional regulator n=1 Tax=Massilia sp. CCM 8734 TaxID=2609283 RepID=UPI001E3236AD|nr:LysR family transcriptional regulator [Massilia sp. CCM 8734]
MMLDDLSLFVAIVEAGSLATAAGSMQLPAATVTRRLQALERALGYKLLNRSARRMQLTAEGAQYYEQCRPLIHALRQATQRLDATLGAISGNIRVLAPVHLAQGYFRQAWSGFLRSYPEVTLEVEMSNELVDVVGSGADLAIRVGEQQDSSLNQKLLASTDLMLVASPAYLEAAGVPRTPGELEAHARIVGRPLTRWKLRDPADSQEVVVQGAPRFQANQMDLALSMALDGLGIMLCPGTMGRQHVASGALVVVLPGCSTERRHIYAAWSQQRYLPARVRALLDYLSQFAAVHPL